MEERPLDAAAKNTEDDSAMHDTETLPKDMEDPLLDHAINNSYNYQDGLSKE